MLVNTVLVEMIRRAVVSLRRASVSIGVAGFVASFLRTLSGDETSSAESSGWSELTAEELRGS